uniref:Uncharacterized protein n=1 Tax=Chromera velia CCMP2878 TaxID=1169474 RepID=A0A0G4H9Y4_9ALVE|eukprot:Cvel_902.t1-p1 / transcript=Cvel_902.t1 / gene=Cvel_902 / organism=Chromera_velia_CCMP2878 / gene_product=hypothetical protein / transcript_product=hypothetical protein / location=Cvel_scaffold28:131449-133698(-) / protein_length=227 / sequence_SO=supercontig / SO=protein_coding / is_pseudo=false
MAAEKEEEWLEITFTNMPYEEYDFSLEIGGAFFNKQKECVAMIGASETVASCTHEASSSPPSEEDSFMLGYFDAEFEDFYKETACQGQRIWIRRDSLPEGVMGFAFGVAIKGGGSEKLDWSAELKVNVNDAEGDSKYTLLPDPKGSSMHRMLVVAFMLRAEGEWHVFPVEKYLTELDREESAEWSAREKMQAQFEIEANKYIHFEKEPGGEKAYKMRPAGIEGKPRD